MMPRVTTWVAGLFISAGLHVALAGAYLATRSFEETPDQAGARSRLELETVSATRAKAQEAKPDAQNAAEQDAEGKALSSGVVRVDAAEPVGLTTPPQASVDPKAVPTPPAMPASDELRPQAAGGQTLAEAGIVASTLPESPPPSDRIAAFIDINSRPLTATEADVTTLPATRAGLKDAASKLQVAAARFEPLAPAPAETSAVAALNASGTAALTAELASETAHASQPKPQISSELAVQSREPTLADVSGLSAVTVAAAAPVELASAALPADFATVAEPLRQTPAQASTVSGQKPQGTVASTAALPLQTVAPERPRSEASTQMVPPSQEPVLADASGSATASVPVAGPVAPQAEAFAADVTSKTLPAVHAKAALAWQFGDRVVTDLQALSTIHAFMSPQTIGNADEIRDDLSSVLTGIRCARLSATFLPDQGVLEMRGHIPDINMQDQVVAALQAQVGTGIPVRANLLHLPEPQCGALTGIASVGLPQSTDQFTNTRLIGETAHAREYVYDEGMVLEFELQAPDYDAVVYVDYFDAAGQVIHLMPNLTAQGGLFTAKSVVSVRPNRPGTDTPIVIGPPFGQEIAVAFAASQPLFATLRPLVEPASAYLEELALLVARAKSANPDFKGEWVYFFITTRPATQ